MKEAFSERGMGEFNPTYCLLVLLRPYAAYYIGTPCGIICDPTPADEVLCGKINSEL